MCSPGSSRGFFRFCVLVLDFAASCGVTLLEQQSLHQQIFPICFPSAGQIAADYPIPLWEGGGASDALHGTFSMGRGFLGILEIFLRMGKSIGAI